MLKINDMKKIFLFTLMAALTAGFAACSDSDDENNNGGTTPGVKRGLTEEQMMQRTAVASVLNKLTGETFSDTTDVDFEGHTYEGTIGAVRNESRPSERSIQVRTATLAEGHFRSLVGGGSSLITETDDGCKIDLTSLDCHSTGKKQSLGTLTFHRAEGGDNIGYADIDIPCIPALQRISYKTPDQWGDNGYVSPIHYGEVYVGEGLYWICVREATSYSDGVLINMQSGKGDDWQPLYETEKWAAWEPEDHRVPEGESGDLAVLEYVNLCGDWQFHTRKKNIMAESFGKEVFPEAWGWNWSAKNEQWELWQYNDPGFGTLDKGYCHRAVYPPAERGVIIVMECTEGHYQWSPPYNWRRWRIYCTGCSWDSVHGQAIMGNHSLDLTDANQLHRVDYMYTYTSEFYRFPYFACIYTARYKSFSGNTPPIGYTKVNVGGKK